MKALCFAAALALAFLPLVSLPALAEESLPFEYRELSGAYPDEAHPEFTFFCRYPYLKENCMAAEEINVFFDRAVGEITELVVPMSASEGGSGFSREYLVTCNNGEFFSIRIVQVMRRASEEERSVSSAVFAVEGKYSGQTLTLRGLLHEMGESSEQIAEKVFDDIWQKIQGEMQKEGSPWIEGLTRGDLALEFYPERDFYAGEDGEAVFYLQPGLFRPDADIVTFSYTAEEIGRMLKQ